MNIFICHHYVLKQNNENYECNICESQLIDGECQGIEKVKITDSIDCPNNKSSIEMLRSFMNYIKGLKKLKHSKKLIHNNRINIFRE